MKTHRLESPLKAKTKTLKEKREANARTLALDGAAWRKLRAAVLRDDPLCPECSIVGELRPATDVDHIDNDPTNNDRSNLVGLCKSHHSKKTWNEQRGRPYLAPYTHPYKIRPALGVTTIVCGPAGSGKTTYVRASASDGDTIIDLDDIRADLVHRYTGNELLRQALIERNTILHSLAEVPQRCWFIVSAPLKHERDWWASRLGTDDVVLLDTPLHECEQRIITSRQGDHMKRSIYAARRWWIEYETQQSAGIDVLNTTHGCDADGMPLDPAHPWNTKIASNQQQPTVRP